MQCYYYLNREILEVQLVLQEVLVLRDFQDREEYQEHLVIPESRGL